MKKLIGFASCVGVLSGFFILANPLSVFAATTPSMGSANGYGVLSSTYTDTSAATTVNGSVGFTTPPATAIAGVHLNYGSGAPYATAGVNQGSALAALALQPCTFTFAPGPINLSTDITHGAAGVFLPGVYCSTGAMNIGGALNLNGAGTYIFRPVGALTSTTGSVVTLTGGSACDVFWTPSAAATLANNTTFAGTIIDDAGITVGAVVNWTGRALSFGGTVTTATDTITAPVCAVPVPVSGGSPIKYGTLNVLKLVVNDNGGTKVVTDFPLFVNGAQVMSGTTNSYKISDAPFTITEPNDAGYVRSFSGDCNASGIITSMEVNDAKFCVITNNDVGSPVVVPPVPPIIDVTKVPNPLALPAGPGLVEYTYTARNIGTVPMSNVTMVGDTCSPIILKSGDTNGDGKLDVNEVWVHTCSTTLAETHTNTVVATGWANGISSSHSASATVVVGVPLMAPLIHVTKVPSPLTLSAGGGTVTYTEKVTNPGTVSVNNVKLVDDKCAPMKYISGDLNSNGQLESSETWTYTCSQNLTKTTTNTAIASGDANGFSVKDVAIATVVVAGVAPALPKTGFSPQANVAPWAVAVISLFSTLALLLVAQKKQKV